MFLKKLRKKIILFKEENPEISIAIVAAIILLIVGLVFIKFIEFDSGLSQNLYATLLGVFLDVLLFGILIVLINKRREKKLDIKRWQEEIDDYRGWDEKEAMFRIVGNIKRLDGHAKTKLDLSYCYLKDAILGTDAQYLIDTVESRLSKEEIEARKNGYLIPASPQKKQIPNLSYSSFIKANLENANLNSVNLEGTNFYGAKLICTKMMFAQLRNANFMRADLRGVDFRGAKGLTAEQLSIAKTLYKTRLSPDIKKQMEDKYPFVFYRPEKELSDFWDFQTSERYFAYGSNMCSRRLKVRLVTFKYLRVPAVINDYSLIFNKTSRDGSGKANIISCPGRQVWGVLYNILDKDMEKLDEAESGYSRKRMTIKLESGIEQEAFIYIADQPSETPINPFTWYVRYLVAGAREHTLPTEYIDSLEAIETTQDYDLVRDQKERAIILGNN